MRGWYKRGGVWCHRYQNEEGRRGEFRGYTDKGLSVKAYERRVDEVRRIVHNRSLGIADTSKEPIRAIINRYLDWGKREGGKNGRPWSEGQKGNSVRYLLGTKGCKGMVERMGVNHLAAITRDRFETALGAWENPKTRGVVGGVVKAFLNWCRSRGLLAQNPIEGWPGRKLESDNQRRMPTVDEFHRLLSVAPPERALAYECIAYTGARAGEINHIRVDSVKWERGGIVLPRKATKNRREHFFPLPKGYLGRLREHARLKAPMAPLFELSRRHKDRYFHQDREAAGLAYETDEGVLTFHSLRHFFETILGYAATDSATELALGRHTDMRTRKKYLHAQEEAKRATVEGIAGILERHDSATNRQAENGK